MQHNTTQTIQLRLDKINKTEIKREDYDERDW